jgi:hypothetical protein
MSLWGKTDTLASVPKWLNANDPNKSNDLDNAFFVDLTEAAVASNKAKGLGTPGWNLYHTYVDGTGNTRHKAEPLIVMKVTAADAGDLGISGNTNIEDTTVPDTIIAITVQPASVSRVAPNTATFTVTATATPTATLTYQWQIQQSNESGTTWTNVGTNAASYTTGVTAVAPGSGATNGDKYRVLVSAPNNTPTVVTSSTAVLTVTAS